MHLEITCPYKNMNDYSYKNLNEKEKRQYSILLVIFIIFGLVWLWAIFKPAKDFTPDLNVPLPPDIEECTGLSGDPVPC